MTNTHRSITVAEFHAELADQGVSHPRHYALKCPICSTPQSMASLVVAGASIEEAERQIGWSCEGRLTNAGSWPKDPSEERKAVRGCDWSLGGLFRVHTLEVITNDGKANPRFEVASAEEAQALEAEMEDKLTTEQRLGPSEARRNSLIKRLTDFNTRLDAQVTAAGSDYESDEWRSLFDYVFNVLAKDRDEMFKELNIEIPVYGDPDMAYGDDAMAWITAHRDASRTFFSSLNTDDQKATS